jgi:hypothetical protein
MEYAEFWALKAACWVFQGVSAFRSAFANWVTTEDQSKPEAKPETASEELPELVAELPTLVNAVEFRNEPRLELLVEVTLDILSFLFAPTC